MRNPFTRDTVLTEKVVKLQEQLTAKSNDLEFVAESLADLESEFRDPGWVRITTTAEQEFSRAGLGEIAAACRLMSVKNPLIVRGVALCTAYIWGQGVEITARANGQRDKGNEQDVNAIVQAFLDDETNRRTFTGEEARVRNERSVRTDGNLFVACFTLPTTGRVQVRILPMDEITEVICNPEDRSEPWYYRRKWTQQTLSPSGAMVREPLERLYPAVGFQPRVKRRTFGEVQVAWDAPVAHLRVNDLDGWTFGVGDVYPAIDWALAYKGFLEDWGRLMKSLSRYAWKATAPGNKAAAVRTTLARTPALGPDGKPNPAGATAVMSPDVSLEAVSKTGATLDSESGRPLAAMVAAALGIPVTMLLGDPGVTGARATAETLDQPTELGMKLRQGQWAALHRRILQHVITEAVRAPKGPLKGRITREEDGREVVTLDGDTDTTISIVWPDLDDVEPQTLVEAITKAAGTGTVPPEMILTLLLQALGVRDVDDIVNRLLDENGRFLWPASPPLGGGQQAADAERDGEDPALVDGGPMTPDDDEPADGGDGGSQPADPEVPP